MWRPTILVVCNWRHQIKYLSRTFHLCAFNYKKKPLKPPPKSFMKFPVHGSIQYVSRQLSDPYVKQRFKEGYRCRSVYKLKEMDDIHHFLQPGMSVVDLGAAPGSWSQVVKERIFKYTDDGKRDESCTGLIIAVDLLRFSPVDGVSQIVGDFTNSSIQKEIVEILKLEKRKGKADVVLCDAAPNASGHKDQDHTNLIKMAYKTANFALKILKPGGSFLFKLWDCPEVTKFITSLSLYFDSVKSIKPDASRDDSSELYILCKNFKTLDF